MTETCKPDSYVGCPPPVTTPPECGDAGWEIGNGTVTCATVVVQRDEPLAATGGEVAFSILALGVALAALGASIVVFVQQERARRCREGAERIARIERTLDDRGSLER